jgi:hypothetical protein
VEECKGYKVNERVFFIIIVTPLPPLPLLSHDCHTYQDKLLLPPPPPP